MLAHYQRGVEILGGEIVDTPQKTLTWGQFFLVGVGLLALGAVGVWLVRKGSGRQGYELR